MTQRDFMNLPTSLTQSQTMPMRSRKGRARRSTLLTSTETAPIPPDAMVILIHPNRQTNSPSTIAVAPHTWWP
jgi:hypothetical protein